MNECKVCSESLISQLHDLKEGAEAYEQGNYEKALEFLLPLAEEGQAMAQCRIATMYHLGLGVTIDARIAEKLYLQAAERGCPVSCNNLAALYSTAYAGVEGKVKDGNKYLEKARELGFDVIAD